MMGSTHVLTGLLIASTAFIFKPELIFLSALAGFAGGVFPDLDTFREHRKTLHYPFYYSFIGVLTLLLALSINNAFLPVSYFLISMALHCLMDSLDAGRDFDIDEPDLSKGVYLHLQDRWLKARRWVKHDGSLGDFLLTLILAAANFYVYTGVIEYLAALALAIGALYALIRGRVTDRLVGSADF